MKKLLSLLVVLCLLAMGAPALAAPGDAILLQSGEDGFTVASSFALIGDTLYALSSTSLFTVPAAGGRFDGICHRHRGAHDAGK